MGLERPLFIASAVHALVGQLSIGAQPGRVILEGGGGVVKVAPSSSPPLPPPARFPWLRGDCNGTPGVQILTGCPPNNGVVTPGLTAGTPTKLTILEGARKDRRSQRERERVCEKRSINRAVFEWKCEKQKESATGERCGENAKRLNRVSMQIKSPLFPFLLTPFFPFSVVCYRCCCRCCRLDENRRVDVSLISVPRGSIGDRKRCRGWKLEGEKEREGK